MNFAFAGNNFSHGKKDLAKDFNDNLNIDEIKTIKRELDLTRNSKIPTVLSGQILHSLGPTETFNLCQEKMISCPEGGLIYKFIKSSQFLDNVNPTFDFNHMLKCKTIIKSDANPTGFKTPMECFKTIVELRNWARLNELQLTTEQKTEIAQQFKSEEALKCRWSRELATFDDDNEWEKKLNECIETIKLELSALGLGSFKEITFNFEPRYFGPAISPLIENRWNRELLNPGENYKNLKTWLDQKGDIKLANK